MRLKIDFPDNLITDELVLQKQIPCFCKVSNEFVISFSDTIPESSGIVLDWDRRDLELRAVAGAGGQYTHYANSLITLKRIGSNVFEIVDLEMFYRSYGWCVILLNGAYAPPRDFWDSE